MIGQTGASLGRWARRIDAGDSLAALIVNQRGSGNVLDLQDGGTSVFTVGQLGAVTVGTSATLTLPNAGLHLLDTNASHDLIISPGSNLTADHTLTLTTGDADRTVTLSGNPTLADWFDQAVKTSSNPTFGNLTITSFAAGWTNAGRTVADLGIVTTVDLNGGTVAGVTIDGASNVADGILFSWGTSNDIASKHSGAVNANTVITGVLVGVPVTPVAIAADSLVVGNVTASGDVLLAVNKGGNSHMAFMADASTGDTLVGAPSGASVDVYVAGAKVADIGTALDLDLPFDVDMTTEGNTGAVDLTFTKAAGAGAVALNWLDVQATVTGNDNNISGYLLRLLDSSTTAGTNTSLLLHLGGGTPGHTPRSLFASGVCEFDGTVFFNGQISSYDAGADALKINLGSDVIAIALERGGLALCDVALYYESRINFVCASNYDFAITLAGTGKILLQQNTTISRASVAGVAGNLAHDIPIGAGGAANAVVKHNFQLDTVDEAGLFGETDGSGSYTQAQTMWKVPYRDSGANVAAPTDPTTAATWLGGLRVEAGDDTNRIYFYANEAWHYVNQTAGLSFRADERVMFGHRWEVGDLGLVKVDKHFGDGAPHGLLYPFEEALRETVWAQNISDKIARFEDFQQGLDLWRRETVAEFQAQISGLRELGRKAWGEDGWLEEQVVAALRDKPGFRMKVKELLEV